MCPIERRFGFDSRDKYLRSYHLGEGLSFTGCMRKRQGFDRAKG